MRDNGSESYFLGLQVQSEAFFPHPEQTFFSMGFPHFLQGVQPHTWHISIPPELSQ
jgi:hypothetical protein